MLLEFTNFGNLWQPKVIGNLCVTFEQPQMVLKSIQTWQNTLHFIKDDNKLIVGFSSKIQKWQLLKMGTEVAILVQLPVLETLTPCLHIFS